MSFSLGTYDARYPLIIDPYLDFSTYLGGSQQDRGYAVAVDSAGSTYVTGATQSTNFPYPLLKPRNQSFNAGGLDVFVTKFQPDGKSMNYSTYLGGYNDDSGQGIAVDTAGNAFITGYTISDNFPIQYAFQPTKNIVYPDSDVFVTALNPTGTTLLFSSYLGGNMTDVGQAIALNASGMPVITGYTGSWNFPNVSAFDPELNGTFDAFVTGVSYDASSSTISFSTFLGGDGTDQGYGLAVHNATGDIYVTGLTRSANFPTVFPAFNSIISWNQDAFVTHMNPTASSLVSSTYLGGIGEETGYGIAVDDAGYIYVTGYTQASDDPYSGFPVSENAFQTTREGIQDAFLSKFEPDGVYLNYSTFLGGSLVDEGTGVAVDDTGSAFITGFTDSPDFPTEGPLFTNMDGFKYDAFVTRFLPNGTGLMYSTYLGGEYDDRAMGIARQGANVSVVGWTDSRDFPLKNPVQPTYRFAFDAFVARIVSIPPTANFTGEALGVTNYTLIKGLPPLLVNFTDLSTGNSTMWSWLFGDGGTSNLQHPSHTYSTGNWTVNLTVSNAEGSNSTGKYWYVQVGPPLIVNFSANMTDVPCTFCQGLAPLNVSFTDLTDDTPVAWNWSFGDGNHSIVQHPFNFTYNIPGLYNVSLNATNWYGSNSTTKYYMVEAGCVPDANFTANVTYGIAPLHVGFSDTSFAVPPVNAWNWSFGDGSANGTTKNPLHIFTARGNYTVNLTVTNFWGTDTESKTEYIRVGEVPVANFTAEPRNLVESHIVNFTDHSTGYPNWWLWDLGDGYIDNKTSNLTFNHTYLNAGNFTIKLTVGNEFGTSSMTRDRYISVWGNAAVANLTFVPSTAIIPTNSTTAMKLILEEADRGLSGYNITIYFTDPSAADMVTFHPPSWVNPVYVINGTVPSSSIWMKVSDIDDVIHPGATNIDLALFNSTGKVPMSTTMNVTVSQIDTDTGDPVHTHVNPAPVTIVALLPFPGYSTPPTDPYHDGVYWDINGNGRIDFDDVILYFLYLEWIQANEPVSLFDYNNNGRIDFDDLYILFTMV
ncbi:MAG: PKD domain protein [Methanoregulaceae archaeon PtaU1.Bin222]|nr:MAG: PKD domain protein [Methanoregulaceae archaeon PtaU1.Bin222]